MSEQAKPTPGPWVAYCDPDGAWGVLHDGAYLTCAIDPDIGMVPGSAEANARLIAEAGTVYHETGLTPRQLLEQRDELLGASELYFKADSLARSCGYGTSGDARKKARAAIAKAKGGAR